MRGFRFLVAGLASLLTVTPLAQQPTTAPPAAANPRLDQYKRDVGLEVDGLGEMVQRMNDQVFSYGELGFQEFETSTVPDRHPAAERVRHPGQPRRHPDGVDGELGNGQAGHRARLRHRRHPAGVTEAGRRVSRSDHRRRAGHGEGHNSGHAAANRGRARGQKDHGAAASLRHAPALAGCGRGAGRIEGVLRSRRRVQGRGHLDLRPRRLEHAGELGREPVERAGLGRVQASTAKARTRPARHGAGVLRWTRWS